MGSRPKAYQNRPRWEAHKWGLGLLKAPAPVFTLAQALTHWHRIGPYYGQWERYAQRTGETRGRRTVNLWEVLQERLIKLTTRGK